MNKPVIAACILLFALAGRTAQAQTLAIVAAENFYGDVASQLGGDHVSVTSILSNPDQDPHLFEASPSTARQLAAAKLVIYNGAGYDPWMNKLIAASKAPGRSVIEVAKLVDRKAGDNPHLWYDPATMPALARRLAATFAAADAADKQDYETRLARFEAALKTMNDKVAAMRQKYAGLPVTATEPVFGYMAEALGLKMRNYRFQLAIMNDTEPSASQVADFEKDLKTKAVRVLFYNNQTNEPMAQRMLKAAQGSGVPIVGVSETEPAGMTYTDWMLAQLNALDLALGG